MFLASTFSDTVNLFSKKVEMNKLQILFISNASDPFKGRKYWVKKDREAFLDNGCDIDEIDLRSTTCEELDNMTREYDIMHICGGSAIYLLKLLKDTGTYDIIKNAISRGRMKYTGTSAGSMIMAPNISFCADDEDEQDAGMVGKLKDMKGLDLMPFYLMCHSQEKHYITSTKNSIDRLPKNKVPILFLNDNMALWIENEKFELLKK